MQAADRPARSRRVLALTPELVARCGPALPQSSPDRFTRASDEDCDRTVLEQLAVIDGEPLAIFSYGSLIWNPGFDVAERISGAALGWRRTFGVRVERAHGSPERHGYMLPPCQADAAVACSFGRPSSIRA